jgi:hypothetical protein
MKKVPQTGTYLLASAEYLRIGYAKQQLPTILRGIANSLPFELHVLNVIKRREPRAEEVMRKWHLRHGWYMRVDDSEAKQAVATLFGCYDDEHWFECPTIDAYLSADIPKNALTVRNVAELTGKSRGTIYRWIDNGSIRSMDIDDVTYVDRDSLRKFLGPDAVKRGIHV